MQTDYDDLSEELQLRLAKYEIELHDIQWELKLHRCVALIVIGGALERLARWLF